MNNQQPKSTTATTLRLVGSGRATLGPFATPVTNDTTEKSRPTNEATVGGDGKKQSPTVLVIGDVIQDWWITVEPVRVSPEHPGVIWRATTMKSEWGAAKTVVDTMARLGTMAVGVLGDSGTAKGRYQTADGTILFRVDHDGTHDPSTEEEVVAALLENVEGASLLLVEDYAKGTLSKAVIQTLCELDVPIWLDPHPAGRYGALMPQLVKCNEHEKGRILHRFPAATLIVTHGSGPVEVHQSDHTTRVPVPAHAPARCVIGAGDCFFGCLAHHYLKNCNLIKAVEFAIQITSDAVMRDGRCIPEQTSVIEVDTSIVPPRPPKAGGGGN